MFFLEMKKNLHQNVFDQTHLCYNTLFNSNRMREKNLVTSLRYEL